MRKSTDPSYQIGTNSTDGRQQTESPPEKAPKKQPVKNIPRVYHNFGMFVALLLVGVWPRRAASLVTLGNEVA